jgi:dTDP-4-dehydrorhamnose 3,5-epimerase
MPFEFRRLAIPEVVLIEARAFADARGYFLETYKQSEFAAYGLPGTFVQCNLSHSLRGVLRGLHYQKEPKAQGKLVTVLRGQVFDVAVDIRKGSPTYGQWVGVTLRADQFRLLFVPEGFAHGFCVLSESADVLYKVTAEYAPELDRGVLWNDPQIGISWPLAAPILSTKDAQLPLLKDADNDFEVTRAAPRTPEGIESPAAGAPGLAESRSSPVPVE